MNEKIKAREIKLIGPEGEQLGTFMLEDALTKAADAGLDLVEVASNSDPPVCKIMDYGRHKFEQKKKTGKKKAHVAHLKEVKLRPRTDDHDLEVKLRKATEFLLQGDKLKVTVMFRGREMVHRSKGYQQLERVTEMLGDLATVENPPKMEGRFLAMILIPNREGVTRLRKELRAEAKRAAKAEAELLGDVSGAESAVEHDEKAKEEARRKDEERAKAKAEKAAKAEEELLRV